LLQTADVAPRAPVETRATLERQLQLLAGFILAGHDTEDNRRRLRNIDDELKALDVAAAGGAT
jgi:hypothetical protein